MIDIIIPAYNCRSTIYKTLSSLCTQTDDDFKAIVVDDCSDEDIQSIVDSFNTLDITYIRNKNNVGAGMSRQIGIERSTSDYITFLDSDDILMPYTVEVFNNMISNNDFDLYHSYFYEQTKKEGQSALTLHKNGFTWHHGKLYKRKFLIDKNIMNVPEVKYNEDCYFNYICMELGNASIIPIPMYLWINNSESITRINHTKERAEMFVYEHVHAFRKAIEFVLNYKSVNELLYANNTMNIIEKEVSVFAGNEDITFEYNKIKKLIGGDI